MSPVKQRLLSAIENAPDSKLEELLIILESWDRDGPFFQIIHLRLLARRFFLRWPQLSPLKGITVKGVLSTKRSRLHWAFKSTSGEVVFSL